MTDSFVAHENLVCSVGKLMIVPLALAENTIAEDPAPEDAVRKSPTPDAVKTTADDPAPLAIAFAAPVAVKEMDALPWALKIDRPTALVEKTIAPLPAAA